ncbi:MAG: D-alanine--D-alanine ligase [Polyangiaceae bacterium]|nr:D-alanine--D-alanine ligase [Polyangiaceae bacterium]
MRIAVLYNAVTGDTPDERDVLDQRDAVVRALGELGHEVRELPCALDLERVARSLVDERPELVFNLVEALGGHGRLLHVVPGLLDALGLPYTGCPSEALFVSSHKLLAKGLMRAAGLPTPAFAVPGNLASLVGTGSVIVKSLWDHASIGLSDASIVPASSEADLEAAYGRLAVGFGGEGFVEGYVDGREFNLSVVEGPRGPEVLPVAEMRFVDYPPDKPRIMGYAAKWEESAFEYHHTSRTFDLPAEDAALVRELGALALRTWQVFGLGGYARVDFRVDAAGRPFILEVNANPCLTPGAGFPAAAERAGLGFTPLVARILSGARRGWWPALLH